MANGHVCKCPSMFTEKITTILLDKSVRGKIDASSGGSKYFSMRRETMRRDATRLGRNGARRKLREMFHSFDAVPLESTDPR